MSRYLSHEGSIVRSSEFGSDSDFRFCDMVIQEEKTSVLIIQGNFNMEKGPNQRAKRKTKLQVLITIPFFPTSEP